MYAIEKDSQVLACAKHNAEVYGVQDRISWYEGDCFEIIKNELAAMGEYAVVFASPPWGGRNVSRSYLSESDNIRPRLSYRYYFRPVSDAAIFVDRSLMAVSATDRERSTLSSKDL